MKEKIQAVTFGFMSKKGEWATEEARHSLRLLKERTNAKQVILAIVAEQDTPQSTVINWQNTDVVTDEEIVSITNYANSIGLEVILKPIVNVTDGTWRAHINFFEYDVPCEPKWSDWFASYTEFILHYAKLAEQLKTNLFVIGCELVNSDRREQQWRELIEKVRQVYSGELTYNCDKYQEEHITWWDAVDVISSSGYYPIDQWDKELDRIEQVQKKWQKPFFFCEVGCPSREGSEFLPNDWQLQGEVSQDAQARWYEAMFTTCSSREWMQGYGLWDWKVVLYPEDQALQNDDYALFGKSAEKIVYNFFR